MNASQLFLTCSQNTASFANLQWHPCSANTGECVLICRTVLWIVSSKIQSGYWPMITIRCKFILWLWENKSCGHCQCHGDTCCQESVWRTWHVIMKQKCWYWQSFWKCLKISNTFHTCHVYIFWKWHLFLLQPDTPSFLLQSATDCQCWHL